jgi:hypothetical protein
VILSRIYQETVQVNEPAAFRDTYLPCPNSFGDAEQFLPRCVRKSYNLVSALRRVTCDHFGPQCKGQSLPRLFILSPGPRVWHGSSVNELSAFVASTPSLSSSFSSNPPTSYEACPFRSLFFFEKPSPLILVSTLQFRVKLQ